MKVALIRHGEAQSHPVDELRKLTEHGVDQARRAGKFLLEQAFRPVELIHSPLSRAEQTGLLVRAEIDNSIPTSVHGELKPNSPLSHWLFELGERNQSIALVGHNPYMSLLAQELCLLPHGFPTGGCLILERSEDKLHWKVLAKNF